MSEERPVWRRAYDRKGFLAISAAAAYMAACGGTTESESEDDAGTTTAARAKQLGGELFYYNWADYVNPKTYPAFEKTTGVKVKKDFYVSNEALQAKLQGGAKGYDLVVPTGYMVQILAGANQLQEIDYSKLPNVEKNIDPKFQGLPFDPDDKYSVPKDWGTTGFVYRTDLVKEKPASWKDFFDLAKGQYSKKVTVLDGIPEVIGSTLVMRGREGARGGEEGADRAQAPPARDHVDRVQADGHLRAGRDGARLERRRSGRRGEEAGRLRDRRGGR